MNDEFLFVCMYLFSFFSCLLIYLTLHKITCSYVKFFIINSLQMNKFRSHVYYNRDPRGPLFFLVMQVRCSVTS